MPIQGIILAACMRVHILRISHPLPPPPRRRAVICSLPINWYHSLWFG